MSRGPRSSSARPAPGAPPRWTTAAAAAALPCLPFLPLLMAGEALWFRDFSLYFVPMKALLVELWRSGELPLWDPYVRNGLPFLANPQVGVFYPPNLLLVAFGLNPGLTLFLMLHLAAAGSGTYVFLRSARFAPAAALVGAVAFAGGGYVSSLLNVLNNLQTAAWIPWMLAFALGLARRRAVSDWLGLVAAAALALLGGELQLALLGLILAAALVLVLPRDVSVGTPEASGAPISSPPRRDPPRGRARTVILLAVAGLAAAALVAVQLLPTADLLRESVRQGGLPFRLAAEHSLRPSSLFSLAFPRPATPGGVEAGPVVGEMPWLLSAYLGASVVSLACVGMAGRRRGWNAFWLVAAGLGVALALGEHSLVFRAAFEVLPPFRSFRFPEKFLLLPALALPALAAAGVERALARRIPPASLVAGAVLVVGSGVGSWLWMDDAVRLSASLAGVGAALALAVTLAALAAVSRGKLAAPAAAAVLCAAVLVDLGWTARAVNPAVSWRFYERPWAAQVLDGQGEDPGGYRVRSTPLVADMEQVAVVGRARFFSNHYFFQQSLAPNLGELYGFLQQDGMAGIETRGTAEQIDALVAQDPTRALRLLRLQAVRYVVTSFPLPASQVAPVRAHPELPVSVTRLRDPLTRAYLAARWRTEPDASRALQDALADDFAAGVEVVLDRDPFPPSPAGAAASGDGAQGKATAEEVTVTDGRGTPGRVRRALWKPSSARFDLELAREAVLVVTDTWFPGWQAELDGRSLPLLRANGYQRAVAVPRGPHTVTLAYRPASLSRGAWISVSAALALSLLGAARGGARGRRAAAPAAGNEVALDGVGPAGGREPREARAGTARTPLGDDSFTEGSVGYEPASGRPLEAGRGADDRP